MHESSLVSGLVEAALQAAGAGNAVRVTGLQVRVGALAGISPGHLAEHFDRVAAGTLLEGARLVVTSGPEGPAALDDPKAQTIALTAIDVETG